MGKVLKVAGVLIGVFVVLLIAASVILPRVINPNDYKAKIAEVVKDRTGRTLTIEGNIGLSVFPWLGLDVNGVRLGNAPGFGTGPFATVDTVEVRVKLLPLLHKQVEMDTVALDGLQLNLARNRDGRTNWQDLVGGGAAPAAPAKAAPAAPAGGSPLAALAIGGIQVHDARVDWRDAASGVHYAVRDFDLESGAIQPGSPFKVESHFNLEGDNPKLLAKVDLGAKVELGASLQQIKVSSLSLDVAASGAQLPPKGVDVGLKGDVDLDLAKHTLEIPALVVTGPGGLKVAGRLSGTGVGGAQLHLNGDVNIDEFVPRRVMEAMGMQPPATADATVLGKAQAAVKLALVGDRLAIPSLDLRFDDSRLTGNATVSNFARPAVGFALNLDKIDLDRYLPPPPPEGKPAAAPATPAAAAAAAPAQALPVQALRDLNLNGTVTVGSLTAYRLHSTDIQLQLHARNGLIQVHPATAKMYDGTYSGDVRLDVSGAQPRISLNETVAGVQAGPLLKDLTGKETLTGKGGAHVQLTGTGQDPAAIRKTLNGNLSFKFEDGSVKGVNIPQMIREARARLKGEPMPTDKAPNQTDFTELGGTATVTNGLVRNDDLLVMSPLLRISGKGTADLASEKLDYLLTTKLVGSLAGQGGKTLEDLKGVAIPVHVGGSFAQPTFGVDLAAALKEEAGRQVEKRIEEKRQDIQKKAIDKLQNLFK